jgi:hypothetical protein
METLHALRPDWSLREVETFLREHNSNANDAALALLDDPIAEGAIAASIAPIMPIEEKDVIDAMNIAGSRMVQMRVIRTLDVKPDKSTQVFPNVKNGNCCPGALMQIVHSLANIPLVRRVAEMELHAASMRETIFHYQLLNFDRACMVTNQSWHEMIAMSHNIGITESETIDFGIWPDSMEGRMEKWMEERDQFYFTTSEIMAFYEMMVCKGAQLVIRVWRQNTPKGNLILLHTIPETHSPNSLIFDLKHTGKNDSVRAHYELLRSGSVNFHKRSAPINYEDMDHSEEGKRKRGGKKPRGKVKK